MGTSDHMDGDKSITLPKISVIIPHLNQPEFLRRCLASLEVQDYSSGTVEIIIVDNGSSELPTHICDQFCKVILLQEPVAGPGPARNTGVAASQAPLLAFIDADCIAAPDWLSVIVDTFEGQSDIEIIGGDVRIAYKDSNNLTMLEAYESIYAYRQEEYIKRQGFSGTGNLAMRRNIFEAVGPFAGIKLAEDRDWGQKAGRLGFQTHYIETMIVSHPARTSMAELYSKWDRHIAHDFEEQVKGLGGKTKWGIKLIAVAVSPIFELWRIAHTSRVKSFHERLFATKIVFMVRLYRAGRMIELLIRERQAARSENWNR